MLKHSHSTVVTVTLTHEARAISLKVSDHGVGFVVDDALAQGGMGLCNMRERAEELGGSLRIDSSEQAGTQVAVLLPLES